MIIESHTLKDCDCLFKFVESEYIATFKAKDLAEDFKRKQIQIYTGWYEFKKGDLTPTIFLIGRAKNYGKFKMKILGFRPYCYSIDSNGCHRSIYGDKLEKIEIEGLPPEYIKRLRVQAEKQGVKIPFEADIPFVRRFMIDAIDLLKAKEPIKPRIVIIDVETAYPISKELISFSINDLGLGILYHNNKFMSESQYELALDLYEKIVNADVITGWNVSFDIEVLESLIKEIDKSLTDLEAGKSINDDILSALIKFKYVQYDGKKLNIVKRIPETKISHLCAVLDMRELVKKLWRKELSSWSLLTAGMELSGLLKCQIDKKPHEMDADELLEYNTVDVIIPEEIEALLSPIEYHSVLAWSINALLEDTIITSTVNDIIILEVYNKHGIVLPSRNYSRKKSGYKAAEPFGKKGVYRDVLAFDLSAAYPSIVLALNASPETKDPKGSIIAPNGVRFNTNKSYFVEALKELLEMRKQIKAKLKAAKSNVEQHRLNLMQLALKTQAAAFSHGIFGYEHSRLFDEELADAITATARNIINLAKEKLESLGLNVIYAHTDSIYFVGNPDAISDLEELLNAIVEKYIKEHGYLYTPRFEFKGYYPRAYIHSAARNVLEDENGEWHVTGMNLVRSDAPQYVKNLEKSIIKMLLDGKSKDEILAWLSDHLSRIKEARPSELGLAKPLKKPLEKYKVKSYHIKALINAKEEYGLEVKEGEKFYVLPVKKLKSTGKPGVIAFMNDEFPEGYEIDYEAYLKSNVYNKIAKMLDVDDVQNLLEVRI